MLQLPYTCPIDHYLDPAALQQSPYAHRERTFFTNGALIPSARHPCPLTTHTPRPPHHPRAAGRTPPALLSTRVAVR
eukprot:91966-Prymnesium_polylepis.1